MGFNKFVDELNERFHVVGRTEVIGVGRIVNGRWGGRV